MKDDCYVIPMPGGGKMEVMIRNGELWLDANNLPPETRRKLLLEGHEIVFDPSEKISYVRATYFGQIWPEYQILINTMARKLGVKLPWPEN